ncbi:MAG TPA: M56 family metallopeptidase [Bryobacteraceae bacterium]|nr:M56 family metallopeptidase [Bryobacteraceae bacterium]
MIPFALNHIWQSTVFAAVVAVVAFALRKHSARARFWLWTFASLKFLVPFAFLTVLGSYLPQRAGPSATEPPTRTLTKLALPFASGDVSAMQLSPLSEQSPIPSSATWIQGLFALWLVGFGSTFGYWLLQSLRLAGIRGAARPAGGVLGQLPLPVLLTDSSLEPGVFGIFNPVLFLPTDVAERLNAVQLQAVVAHELVHVRRRDNLWAALHAIVQAVFWFHPLVWWLGRRLVAEREQACDEAVLAQGADAEDYAASILAVCRYYACAPRASLAGVASADLKQRIAAIMKFGPRRYSSQIRVGLAALAVAAVVTPVILGRVYGQTPQYPSKLTFDVASIHEWGPGQGPTGRYAAGVEFSTGRVRSRCASLQALIFYAYGLTGSERLEGLPKWGNASCGYPDSAGTFAIEATMPANTTIAQSREMMQSLLAERFKLAAHWETRKLPVYALRIAGGKSKLKPSDPDKDPPNRPGSIGCPADDPHCHIGFCCGSTTTIILAGTLTHALGRPVIDKTGLTGSYFFGVLKWAGDESVSSSLPSLPALLREEFGLELKPERGPVPVLVIDHAEKPLAN